MKRLVETVEEQFSLETRRPDLTVNMAVTVKDGHTCSKGDVLGVITSGGLLRRRPVSLVGETEFGTGSTLGSVEDGTLFKAGDVLKAYAPVQQVETATVVGTIGASGAGNATVIITSALMSSSPKTYSVAVANNDTAAQVAGKIRTALALPGELVDFYDVSGSGANVILTAKEAAANDATLNIDIDNGTCSGLTDAPTSVNTTPGRVAMTTVGTVLSISGNDITLTGNASIAVAEGAVIAASDGSQVAAVIAEEGSDGDGDTPINVITQSPALDISKLGGLDDSAITDLGGRVLPGNLLKL